MSQKRIAEESGVSIMTVSRVLRGSGDVAKETRRRVLEVAAKYHYRPNLLVRGIQTGSTKTIGLLLPPLPFYTAVLTAIHDTLVQADNVPMLLWSGADCPSTDAGVDELSQIHRLMDRRVDGVIIKPVSESASERHLQDLIGRDIPFVVLDRELAQHRSHFVGSDDYAGGQAAATHLLSLGHKRCCIIAPGENLSTYALRTQGFQEACAQASEVSVTFRSCAPTEAELVTLVTELIENAPPPTAIFATTDEIIPSIYQALAQQGLSIPRDVSVLGFGNLAQSACLQPALSTVEQFPYAMGKTAVEALLALIANKEEAIPPRRQRLPVELLARASTGPCP